MTGSDFTETEGLAMTPEERKLRIARLEREPKFDENGGRAMYRNVPGSATAPGSRTFDEDGNDIAAVDPDEVSADDVLVPTGNDHTALAHSLHWLLSARTDDALATRCHALAALIGITTPEDAARKRGLSRSAIDKAISGFRESARLTLNSEAPTE